MLKEYRAARKTGEPGLNNILEAKGDSFKQWELCHMRLIIDLR